MRWQQWWFGMCWSVFQQPHLHYTYRPCCYVGTCLCHSFSSCILYATQYQSCTRSSDHLSQPCCHHEVSATICNTVYRSFSRMAGHYRGVYSICLLRYASVHKASLHHSRNICSHMAIIFDSLSWPELPTSI